MSKDNLDQAEIQGAKIYPMTPAHTRRELYAFAISSRYELSGAFVAPDYMPLGDGRVATVVIVAEDGYPLFAYHESFQDLNALNARLASARSWEKFI